MNVSLTDHASWRWCQRSDDPTVDPLVAWIQGVEVRGTSLEGDEIRYHERTDTCLIRKNDALVTVVNASRASPQTREAVTAIDGGGQR